MHTSFMTALVRFAKQMATLSPIMFIFQAKIIGAYVMDELRYGGATYVATGRGLPTERRHFLFSTGKNDSLEWSGLYLDYAKIVYYDGLMLLGGTLLVVYEGGISVAGVSRIFLCLGLTIVAWLWGPFIFNPYQFNRHRYQQDLKGWATFSSKKAARTGSSGTTRRN